MDTHVVKSWCYLYSAAIAGYKTHDFRDMTERDYKVGDRMHFREFDQTTGTYTGREALFQITYITDNRTPCAMSSCALEKKYGVLSIKLLDILKPKECKTVLESDNRWMCHKCLKMSWGMGGCQHCGSN